MALCAAAAVTYSCIDVIGHVGPVQLVLHGFVHLMVVRVTDQKEIMTMVKEAKAYRGRYDSLCCAV